MVGSVCLSAVGKLTKAFFEEIPNHFEGDALDEFVVMPNHLHGISIIRNVVVGSKIWTSTKAKCISAY